jgi:polyisoprenoid-binding protein YceI
MKKTILILASMIASLSSQAQNWKVDAAHTNVGFTVDYMVVSELVGNFKKYDATVSSDKPDFSDIKINFTIDVNSVNTENEMRDKHLKSDDFFNTEKFPSMTFQSLSMKKVSDKKYILEGNLTIRDVTKKVQFDVNYGGTVNDPWGNTKAGFKASAKINRLDYGLKYNSALETGEMVASNEVTININTVLIKQK